MTETTKFVFNPYPDDKFTDSSIVEEFADKNLKFDENKKFSKCINQILFREVE